jgi:hypothetical protein
MAERAGKVDWGYRIVQLILTAVITYLVGWSANKLETFSSLPGKVNKIAEDQAALQVSVDGIKTAQDEMKRTQAGFATGAEVKDLRSDVDTLTGRVNTMETTVNSLVKPVAPRPGR